MGRNLFLPTRHMHASSLCLPKLRVCMPLTLLAPAKINLGLHVLRKRTDGYHDIETVLHRIAWADTITLRPADHLEMTCSDPELPTDTDNLCLQAAHRLAKRLGTSKGASIHLEKRVPYGAGLGGGSSDAATTLRGLVQLWDTGVARETLHEVAATIGSDVPFFLLEAPAAYATGRGDRLTPLHGDTSDPFRMPYTVAVVAPPVYIATPDAYRRVTPNDTDRLDLRETVASMDVGRWRAELGNDFEAPIANAYPSVGAARDLLHDHGADYVSLSGSGAAVYGVFTAPAQAEAACHAAAHDGYRTHRTPPTE